jgi:hypothetical protein
MSYVLGDLHRNKNLPLKVRDTVNNGHIHRKVSHVRRGKWATG